MKKRIFVSIDLPANLKLYLKSLQNPGIYWIKWMSPENMHITLNFLGELGTGEVQETKQILTQTALEQSAFELKLSAIRPERDMLWIIPEENETLYELQQTLKQNLRGHRLGKRERRDYAPHILLGKSKTGRPMREVVKDFQPQEFLVDRINLYESRLTPEAATHILIQSFALTPSSSPPHEGEKEWGS